jgi:hypothetical protein
MAPARKDEAMDDGYKILLETILTEQRATAQRIVKIETALAEKRGERRVAVWLAGVVSAGVSFFIHQVFGR